MPSMRNSIEKPTQMEDDGRPERSLSYECILKVALEEFNDRQDVGMEEENLSRLWVGEMIEQEGTCLQHVLWKGVNHSAIHQSK